ncbi:MAG TPA: tRNA (N6-threonylcarbamoyladenosine(37)-N6)-methyltransferase TrmO [Anaerolineales bacterium]|nr:tRNA (N6-threonylcarbamoyladenosine(37)-N6)-methyltransferase TrmO [Anaerolineales bacterium]
MDGICYHPIGVIRSPYTQPKGMPIQSAAARGVTGRIELDSAYADGLHDIAGFSHLWLIYHLHCMTPGPLTVTPFLDDRPHGIFATRSPRRPNAIGLSAVRLLAVDGSILHIEEVDVLDGTPLLDIKPYVPEFDHRVVERIGWFASNIGRLTDTRSDDRFRALPPDAPA